MAGFKFGIIFLLIILTIIILINASVWTVEYNDTKDTKALGLMIANWIFLAISIITIAIFGYNYKEDIKLEGRDVGGYLSSKAGNLINKIRASGTTNANCRKVRNEACRLCNQIGKIDGETIETDEEINNFLSINPNTGLGDELFQ